MSEGFCHNLILLMLTNTHQEAFISRDRCSVGACSVQRQGMTNRCGHLVEKKEEVGLILHRKKGDCLLGILVVECGGEPACAFSDQQGGGKSSGK